MRNDEFQEILSDISSQGNDMDNHDRSIALKKLGSLWDDRGAKVQVFGSENKEKRMVKAKDDQKINDLSATIEDLKTQLSKAQNSDDRIELDRLRASETKRTENAKTELQKKLADLSKQPKWDKVKTHFSVQKKDGKFDLSELNSEQVANLKGQLKLAEDLGGLGEVTDKADVFSGTQPRLDPNSKGLPPEDLGDRDKVSAYVSKELSKGLSL